MGLYLKSSRRRGPKFHPAAGDQMKKQESCLHAHGTTGWTRNLQGTYLATVVCAAAAMALPQNAASNGFRVPPESATGLGLANALVADPIELGATPYNPATIAFHKRWNASLGLVAIDNRQRVSNAAGTSNSDVTNPAWVPNGYLEGPLWSNARWGVTFDTPFGQQTNWPTGSFPGFAGPIAGLAPTRSKIELLSVNPAVSWNFGNATGVAVGLNYYNVREARLDSAGSSLKGDGDALGWQFGLLYEQMPWSFGLTYHSSVNVPIDGDLATPFASASAHTHLRVPARAQAGVRYALHPNIALEFDLEYTGWSRFGTITIEHDNPSAPNPLLNTNNWRDTVTYRLGLSYAWRPDTTLRLGYSYDPFANRDAHFSPRNPDSSSNSFSVGVGHSLGNWRIDAAYMYVRYDTRTFSSDVPFGAYGFDANGTQLFNGTYHSRAQLVALNLTTSF